MAKDWLFGFLEDAGVGEVVYAEDDGMVTIDKRARCPYCNGVMSENLRDCMDCERTYHRACYWRHPCKQEDR